MCRSSARMQKASCLRHQLGEEQHAFSIHDEGAHCDKMERKRNKSGDDGHKEQDVGGKGKDHEDHEAICHWSQSKQPTLVVALEGQLKPKEGSEVKQKPSVTHVLDEDQHSGGGRDDMLQRWVRLQLEEEWRR